MPIGSLETRINKTSILINATLYWSTKNLYSKVCEIFHTLIRFVKYAILLFFYINTCFHLYVTFFLFTITTIKLFHFIFIVYFFNLFSYFPFLVCLFVMEGKSYLFKINEKKIKQNLIPCISLFASKKPRMVPLL